MKDILNRFYFWKDSVHFKIKMVEQKPLTNEIPGKTIVIVGGKTWSKWVFMKCPCGCGDVLTLSLMRTIEPCWKLLRNKKNKITLSPSVRKKDGCKSHFFVRKGRLIWVSD